MISSLRAEPRHEWGGWMIHGYAEWNMAEVRQNIREEVNFVGQFME